jgi:hypothetical protein
MIGLIVIVCALESKSFGKSHGQGWFSSSQDQSMDQMASYIASFQSKLETSEPQWMQ